VNVNVTGEIDEQQIAPLLLVTFLENAFKHCDKQRSNGSSSMIKHLRSI
jgi:sensor histidine kinase YesM